MKVTSVRLKGLEDKGKLKAIGSITLDESFVVSGISVIDGAKGLFVSLPATKGADEKYHDTAYPLSKELREEINKAVMDEYNRSLDLDRIIESVDIKDTNVPFQIGVEEPAAKTEKVEKTEKTSIKDKLKNAAERVSGQTTKNTNEKVKEATL